MRVITFFNKKGGVGKTTLSCHFAAWLHENGNRVLFVDVCEQGNSTNFFNEHISKVAAIDFFTNEINEIENNNFVCLSGETIKINVQNINKLILDKNINLFRKSGFDYVIFDTSPALSTLTIGAFVVSDGVFCPTHLHNFSYSGINKTVETIAKINAKNQSKIKLFGIIPNSIDPRSSKQKVELGKIINAHKEKVMPALLNRKPFSDSMNGHTPVWNIKPQAGNIKTATNEMKRLMKAIEEVTQSEAA